MCYQSVQALGATIRLTGTGCVLSVRTAARSNLPTGQAVGFTSRVLPVRTGAGSDHPNLSCTISLARRWELSSDWTSTGWEVVSSGTGSPTLVSEDEPTGTFPEGALWIDPTCDPTVTGTGTFSNLNPPVYVDPPVTQQANGLPIGLSPDGLELHDLHPCVGAVPVSVGGTTYLMPLFEAPSDLRAAPLFTFDDPPTTQTLAGDYIGVSPDGQVYFEPSTVGGIPVVVAGKTYLLPLWER